MGAYPVMNFQYRIVCRLPTLAARLAVQNKTFEAGGIDALATAVKEAADNGDQELLRLFEYQEADEIAHVRFANEYLRNAIAGNPRVALDVAAALTEASSAFAEVFGAAAHQIRYDVSAEARREAGFLPEEIRAASAALERKRAAAGR
ncbi:MAG: ferritin-like domain-containing protein [Gammaproteobacteria bacterium]|nr:MAG: ferritin-like domain-containing protein [Gammaproteobacteria bacterium]